VLLPAVEYACPETIEDALRLLGENDNARALAGGQTLINVMKARAAAPDVLVDLARIGELKEIRATDGGLEIGSMATYAQLIGSSDVNRVRPILAEVAAQIADVQVRNRGTLGGNICSSDPTNHFPPVLVALGASMTIRGQDGGRTVPAEDFFLGVYMTAAGPGELLTKVTIPEGGADGFASMTIGRNGTCIVNAAATLNGGAQGLRIALGCVSAVPVRATEMESRLGEGEITAEKAREAASGLGTILDPPADVHASADYRRHLAEVLAARAVLEAAERKAAA
jgi:carbon-monoxide dehydrogenase medium subunit